MQPPCRPLDCGCETWGVRYRDGSPAYPPRSSPRHSASSTYSRGCTSAPDAQRPGARLPDLYRTPGSGRLAGQRARAGNFQSGRHPHTDVDDRQPPGGNHSADTPGPRLGLSDVTRIQVRGGASGTGALVGAGGGFAGGLAAGVGLSSSLCSDGGCSNAGGGTAVIALGATAAGALVGALIGAPLRRWPTVYQAR